MKKVNVMKLDKSIEMNYLAKNIFKLDVFKGEVLFSLDLIYLSSGYILGIVIDDNNKNYVENIIDNYIGSIPKTLREYRYICTDTRTAKVVWSQGTGNSSKNSYSTSLYIPITWLRELGLSENYRDVIMEFDGEEIIIKKK